MEYFFIYILLAVLAFATISVAIVCIRDLVVDTRWFRSTKMGMNYHNRLNKVEILTKEEYMNLWSGKTVEME